MSVSPVPLSRSALWAFPGVLKFLNARELQRVSTLGRGPNEGPSGGPAPPNPADAEAAARVAGSLRAGSSGGALAPPEFSADISSPLDIPVRAGAGAQSWLEALDELESWQAMREASAFAAEALPENRCIFVGVRRLAELEVMARRTFPFGSLYFRLAAVRSDTCGCVCQWRRGLVDWVWNVAARLHLAPSVAGDAFVIADRFLLVELSRGGAIVARDLQLVYFAALCASVRVHGCSTTLAELKAVSGASFYADADVVSAERIILRAFEDGAGRGSGAPPSATAQGSQAAAIAPQLSAAAAGGVLDSVQASYATGAAVAPPAAAAPAKERPLNEDISIAVATQPASFAAALTGMLPPAWARRVESLVEDALLTCHMEPELHRFHPGTRAAAAVFLALRVLRVSGLPAAKCWLAIAARAMHLDIAVVRECSDAIEALAGPRSPLSRAEPVAALSSAELDAMVAALPQPQRRRARASLATAAAASASPTSSMLTLLAALAQSHPRSRADVAVVILSLRDSSGSVDWLEDASEGVVDASAAGEAGALIAAALGATLLAAPFSSDVEGGATAGAEASEMATPQSTGRLCTGASAAFVERDDGGMPSTPNAAGEDGGDVLVVRKKGAMGRDSVDIGLGLQTTATLSGAVLLALSTSANRTASANLSSSANLSLLATRRSTEAKSPTLEVLVESRSSDSRGPRPPSQVTPVAVARPVALPPTPTPSHTKSATLGTAKSSAVGSSPRAQAPPAFSFSGLGETPGHSGGAVAAVSSRGRHGAGAPDELERGGCCCVS